MNWIKISEDYPLAYNEITQEYCTNAHTFEPMHEIDGWDRRFNIRDLYDLFDEQNLDCFVLDIGDNRFGYKIRDSRNGITLIRHDWHGNIKKSLQRKLAESEMFLSAFGILNDKLKTNE